MRPLELRPLMFASRRRLLHPFEKSSSHMPLAGARRTTTKSILGSLDTNAAAAPDTRASRKHRESLHIADAACWPDPSEAAVKKQEEQAQKLKQAHEDGAVEKEWRARLLEVEASAENRRRDAEAAAAAAEAERRATAEKAARVVAALEEADVQRAQEEAAAAARQAAKKKAKLDAQERKARRLSAAAWAERPAMAVWPSEEDLLLGTSVPLPATPVQQRYEGRLSRARKVNSERRSVTRPTPAAVEKEEGGEEEVKAEVEEVAEMAMVEEEKVEEAAAESSEQTAEAAVVPPPPPPPAATTVRPRKPSTDADEQAACSSGAANLYLHTSHYVSRYSTISHYIFL